MNSNDIRNYARELRTAADAADVLATQIEGFGGISGPSKTRAKRTPSPAGARKSIHHPNETDIKVLDAMLGLKMDQIKTADVVEALAEFKIEKIEVQKSINYLKSAGHVTTNGRGRGTSYTLNITSNDLEVVDPATLDGYRNPDGPDVKSIVRAIFNCMETLEKVSPAQIVELVQEYFPDQNLTRSSFGTTFADMAKANELFSDGKGRGRVYWRGPEKLENAADFPDGNTPIIDRSKDENKDEAQTG